MPEARENGAHLRAAAAVGLLVAIAGTTVLLVPAPDPTDIPAPHAVESSADQPQQGAHDVPLDPAEGGPAAVVHRLSAAGTAATDESLRGHVPEASVLERFAALERDFAAAHERRDWDACNDTAFRMNREASADPALRRWIVAQLTATPPFPRAESLLVSLRGVSDPFVDEFLLSYLECRSDRYGHALDSDDRADMLHRAAIRSLLLLPEDQATRSWDRHYPSVYEHPDGGTRGRLMGALCGNLRPLPSRPTLHRLDALVDLPDDAGTCVQEALFRWRDPESIDKLLARIRGDVRAGEGLRADLVLNWRRTLSPSPAELASMYNRELPSRLRRTLVESLEFQAREIASSLRDGDPEALDAVAWARAIADQEPDADLAEKLRSIVPGSIALEVTIDGVRYVGPDAVDAVRRVLEERKRARVGRTRE